MTFNPQRAEALRSAIHSTLDWLRIHSGDTAKLLTEHLALLQEAELIYLTDAFVGEGEDQIAGETNYWERFKSAQSAEPDPHAELRKTWKPGQRWQMRSPGEEWRDLIAEVQWAHNKEYCRHPDDVDPTAESGWVGWSGGEMPVPPRTRIVVKHRSGRCYPTSAGGGYACRWTHEGLETDIVAYEVLK